MIFALYVEAQVHSNLLQVIEKPIIEKMKQYLPLDQPNDTEAGNSILLAVHINIFVCGGLAIGVQMSHKKAYGMSLATFMNAWPANCRGDADIHQSSFELARLFPPRNLSNFSSTTNRGITKEKIATKSFVFDKEKLAKLKRSCCFGSWITRE
ncbi:hypothetical protein ACH5RR_023140 [Cinchona calisaya]|uniref:Uncharacterized protein n=1 Tax=Cinchona calisaya TaxID=153742 RepID=A0ABD2Z9V3_9GENT